MLPSFSWTMNKHACFLWRETLSFNAFCYTNILENIVQKMQLVALLLWCVEMGEPRTTVLTMDTVYRNVSVFLKFLCN